MNYSKGNMRRVLLSASLTGAMLCSAAVPAAHAADRAKCQRNIEKSEMKLEEAIRKHGAGSRQAQQRRRDLNNEREKCWNTYRAWYNGSERQWHNARDWDRDHDRH